MIKTKNLTKIFRKKSNKKQSLKTRVKNFIQQNHETIKALDNVNIKIKKGEILGLIGPNGAGKTTLVKILSTLILPDEGTAMIDGHNVLNDGEFVRSKIGAITGEYTRTLYWRLSGRQNLEFFADLYNMEKDQRKERIEFLIKLLDLEEWEDELVMRYSTGMKHKLALARALINNPPILFLDEPTTGLDPKSSFEIRNFVKKELKDRTVLWTSHYLHEIEEICDRVAMINDGKIVFEGNPKSLLKDFWDYERVRIELLHPKANLFDFFDSEIIDDFRIEIKTKNLTETLLKINQVVKENNLILKDLKTLSPSLEDLFIKEVEES
ncbi:MAG: ABC transporter ATP-binding protein, partial [Candidatus Methanofastidiosia archaeon]